MQKRGVKNDDNANCRKNDRLFRRNPYDIRHFLEVWAYAKLIAEADGIDYRILLAANYIVNASENEYAKQSIEKFTAKVMKTESGTHLLRAVFALKK